MIGSFRSGNQHLFSDDHHKTVCGQVTGCWSTNSLVLQRLLL